MKKILFVIAIVIMFGMSANAQIDGFFSSWSDGGYRTGAGIDPGLITPNKPLGSHDNAPADAPLGSGLVILTALGAGYAVRKYKKN